MTAGDPSRSRRVTSDGGAVFSADFLPSCRSFRVRTRLRAGMRTRSQENAPHRFGVVGPIVARSDKTV